MQKVKQRPGAKKGVPKPPKRTLDEGFPARLKRAIDDSGLSITAVANAAHCSRAVIHKYLNGSGKIIEVFVLFDLAKALKVSPDWLLLGGIEMSPKESLTKEQRLTLDTLDLLTTADTRTEWLREGFRIHRQQIQGPSRKGGH